MESKKSSQNKLKSVNWQITLKVFIIGIITLALLVPKFMIIDLIGQRQNTGEKSSQEVMQTWSLAQTVRGPVLAIPYIERSIKKNGSSVSEVIRECYILPKNLNIRGKILPEKRKRSIYETVVYESEINFTGKFDDSEIQALKIPPGDILWEQAKIQVAISDLRGISDRISFTWNDSVFAFTPGMENQLLGPTGISLPLSNLTAQNFPTGFHFFLHLKGSESLQFAPLGETTEVILQSSWNDPGFAGNFLPTDHTITKDGFSAKWKVLNFNRNFPQQWKN
jgi:inner membrane protein